MLHAASTTPRTLVWATELDVLPAGRVLERRGDHLCVSSPQNPGHWWGNLLIFDRPPRRGDGERWERAFAESVGADPRVTHRTFAWEGGAGELGEARGEFLDRGYGLERMVGLIAARGELAAHPRADREVRVRTLDPAPGADAELWAQVVELWVDSREPRVSEQQHRAFTLRRLADLRTIFSEGRGAWYVAMLGEEIAGSCGIVLTAGRARFQAVDTAAAHRRRGICSRLVVEAARDAERRGAQRLVICADPGYHALGLYESLGFRPVESAAGVCLQPPPPPVA